MEKASAWNDDLKAELLLFLEDLIVKMNHVYQCLKNFKHSNHCTTLYE